jgi:hypothetical protein
MPLLTDLKVFDTLIQGATIEALTQMVNAFNAASNGAIVLSTEGFDGAYIRESFFSSLHSAQRRVDLNATHTTASPTSLTQDEEVGVKVVGGFGPIEFNPIDLDFIGKSEDEAIAAISNNLAEAILKDKLNSAIRAAVAAIGNQADATYDAYALGSSPVEKVTYANINNAHAKFGDMSSNIVCNVMNGATYHKLIGDNLSNSNRLFTASGVTIVDILGKATVVTDADALTVDSPAKYNVLGLTRGGALVYSQPSSLVVNTERSNGDTVIKTSMQADYNFGLRLKGYKWDIANGGQTPSDAEVATGSNWDLAATSIKSTAGVLLVAGQ